MKITEPIDVYILRILDNTSHYNPVKVWWEIHTEILDVDPDNPEERRWTTDYVNQQMAILANNELLGRLEPTDRSALYRISDFGRAALAIYDETGRTHLSYADLIEWTQGEE